MLTRLAQSERRVLAAIAACITTILLGCSQNAARSAADADTPPAKTASEAISSPADSKPADLKLADTRPVDNKPNANKPRTIELVIDYGDGVQKRFADIPWRESMTVLDVLQLAKSHSHGISFTSRGSGETLMVTKLDDLSNQGGAASDKNWIFRLNGRLGDESCAIAKVQPGDTVLWKFGAYE